MESVVAGFFLHNWQRKLVALLTALIVWIFVNHSIYETKTISNVPIRIINLPADKTIPGLLPNGMLSRRITLTLTGSKDVIDEIEPSDLEVLLDASTADTDEWVVQVSKKNLVSLNPSIDLPRHITQVEHSIFVIKLSRLVTAKVALTIDTPTGEPPQGYEYLDIWPQHIYQTVSGPEEEIQQLKAKGLEITFDLSEISKSELDAVKSTGYNDEISFSIPKKWKQVAVPFLHTYEDLNDPEALTMRIDFLRKEFLPFAVDIPIRVFYSLEDLNKINPQTSSLAFNDIIQKKFGIAVFTKPVFAKEVSRLFIDVVRNSIEIVILAAPKDKRKVLAWSLQFINPHELEDTYVAMSLGNVSVNKGLNTPISIAHEEVLRKRFREYMQRLTLYLPNGKKLHLKSIVDGDLIRVNAY